MKKFKVVEKLTGEILGDLISSNNRELVVRVNGNHIKYIPFKRIDKLTFVAI